MNDFRANPDNPHYVTERGRNDRPTAPNNQPLSGSKKTKNRNHSRNNHGEGH